MNKKGELTTSEVLGIVLAVLGLVLLFFGATKLLYGVTVDQEAENVKNVLNVIKTRAENLKDGESGRFVITGQEGWFLAGWGKDEQSRPDKCYFSSCVCICKGEPVRGFYSGERFDERKEVCQERGYCREIDKDIVNIIGIEKIGYIKLPENSIELEINKTKTELIIKKNE